MLLIQLHIWKMHNWSGNYFIIMQGNLRQDVVIGRPNLPYRMQFLFVLIGRTVVHTFCQTLGPPNEEKIFKAISIQKVIYMNFKEERFVKLRFSSLQKILTVLIIVKIVIFYTMIKY